MKRILAFFKKKRPAEFSKQLIRDIRILLWIITLGGMILAYYCVYVGYTSSLPWISAMVGLPWAAHGTVCSFYLNMAKSDHKGPQGEGITFATASATNFGVEQESPPI